jgi:hypothetical protein
MLEYSQEQLRDLYNSLPKELQDALYSEKNAENLDKICRQNNVSDEDVIFDVAKIVGYVLFGLMPPGELSFMIEKELKIEKPDAIKIGSEISRYVFFPLKKILEPLYGIEMKFEEKKEEPVEKQAEKPNTKKKIGVQKSDSYRESVE